MDGQLITNYRVSINFGEENLASEFLLLEFNGVLANLEKKTALTIIQILKLLKKHYVIYAN